MQSTRRWIHSLANTEKHYIHLRNKVVDYTHMKASSVFLTLYFRTKCLITQIQIKKKECNKLPFVKEIDLV